MAYLQNSNYHCFNGYLSDETKITKTNFLIPYIDNVFRMDFML